MDVVYKPPFVPQEKSSSLPSNKLTWDNICLLYGTRITKTISTGLLNGARQIYAVPEGKIFLLLTAQIGMQSEDPAVKDARVWGGVTTSPTNDCTILRVVLGRGDTVGQNKQVTASVSPAIPLIYNYGEALFIANPDDDTETHGSITGYEIDASVFYKNI